MIRLKALSAVLGSMLLFSACSIGASQELDDAEPPRELSDNEQTEHLPISPTTAEAPDTVGSVPVLLIGHPSGDICDTWMTVAPEIPTKDGLLQVNNRPSRKGSEVARLPTGHPIIVCRLSEDHKWGGVVFPDAREDNGLACIEDIPTDGVERVYEGPCRWGWVQLRYLVSSAG